MQKPDIDSIFRDFQMKKFSIKKTVPTVTMTKTINAQTMMDLKTRLNEKYHDTKITLTHLAIKAIADTLIGFPSLFSFYHKRQILPNPKLVLNIPVDVGNHVEYIVIHSPESKSVQAIAEECRNELGLIKNQNGSFWKFFQEMCKKPGQMLGGNYIKIIQEHYGNFVFSNFGSFNIEQGTIALSSPMTAGISMGALISSIQRKDDSYIEAKYFLMSISFDHRVIDGAYVGRFMNALQQRIENENVSEVNEAVPKL